MSAPASAPASARWRALPLLLALLVPACSPPFLATPRNMVFLSGARLAADVERLEVVHDWTLAQLERISCVVGEPRFGPPSVVGWDPPATRQAGDIGYCPYPGSVKPVPVFSMGWGNRHLRRVQDPTIHVHTHPDTVDTFPWTTLEITGDTARVRVTRAQPDLHTAYSVYAFLHLMHRQGRLEVWLPDTAGADGYAVERAIVKGMIDVWLLGRATFNLEPHQPMDELLHASESGYLDAFLFTARPDDFPGEREQWLSDNPGEMERYRAWFVQVLEEEPPGPGVRGMRGERRTGGNPPGHDGGGGS